MDLCTPVLFWGGAIPACIPWSVMMLPMNLTSLVLTCSLLSFSLMFFFEQRSIRATKRRSWSFFASWKVSHPKTSVVSNAEYPLKTL